MSTPVTVRKKTNTYVCIFQACLLLLIIFSPLLFLTVGIIILLMILSAHA